MSKSILIVDDEPSIREVLTMILEFEGYAVASAANGKAALDQIEASTPDAVILDVKMPGMDGLEVLQHINTSDPSLPVIVLTGHGNIETAVEATKKGAFDFLSKPPDRDKVLITIRNALAQKTLIRENIRMKKEIETSETIIGDSAPMKRLRETIERIARSEAYVLITGENGTGKELVAKALHRLSGRKDRPLVEVNCAAIPTELIESELFGHEKGSFTGAATQRIGKFEQAHTGTLFLDEIGDMSLQAQAKVLRVLEESTLERVGGNRLITVDVRVIAATNKKLQDEIEEGHFREDLFHRLNVIPIEVPPLRERREDIPVLAAHFLREACRKNKLPVPALDHDAVELLQRQPWPGNVRELRNAVERLAILIPGKITRKEAERFFLQGKDKLEGLLDQNMSFEEFKNSAESMFIKRRLEENDWNISRTAEVLDIQRSHLYSKIKKYNLEREGMEEEG